MSDRPQVPAVTLHLADLAWLELMVSGALPRRYSAPHATELGELAPRLPELAVSPTVALAAAEADQVNLLDPEGVQLAVVTVSGTETISDNRTLIWGAVTPGVPFTHPDHHDLRSTPAAVASSWSPGPAVALWGDVPLTLAVREAARTRARTAQAPLLEVVPLPSGHETDVHAQLVARLARLETTRDPGDRAVVVPDPGLQWTAADLLTKARIVAEFAVDTLLVPPGRLHNLGRSGDDVVASAARFGVTLEEVPAHAGETRLDPRVIDRLMLSGEPFPDWFAEPEVADEFRRLHRPRQRAGFTVLLSGLSGSGKSTVARALAATLLETDSRSVTLLDGDVVRHHLSQGLGFNRTDRDINVRRIGFVAAQITKAGGIAIACPIAPYAATRADVRAMVEPHGPYVLVHVSTPLEECERRDRKGLYAKARRGEIPEFTGISDPYEEPTDADVVVDTTHVSVDDAVALITDHLRRTGLIPGDPQALQPGIPPFASPRA